MTQAQLATPPRRAFPARSQMHVQSQPRRSLKHSFVWLAIGNIVNAACAWGRVAMLAHYGKSEMIGDLVLAWAICNPLSSLLDLGLSSALISDAAGEFRMGVYLRLRLATGTATLLAIGATLWLGGYSVAHCALIFAAGMGVVAESICDIFQAQSQRCEAMSWVSLSLMVRGLLGLTAFAIIQSLTGSLPLAVAGLAGAACIALLAIDIPAALYFGRSGRSLHTFDADDSHNALRRSARYGSLIQLAWLSLPLGLATASLDLTTALPRYSISHLLGSAALGSFAVAGGLMVAMSLVVGAMSQAASPRLARLYATGKTDQFVSLIWRLVLYVVVIGAAATAGMLLAGKPALYLLYGAPYMPLDRLAALLMAVAGLRNLGVLLSRTLSSMRKFRLNLALRLVGLAVLAAMLPGWVAFYGIWGAAWALGLSWLITSSLSMAAVLLAVNRRRRSILTLR